MSLFRQETPGPASSQLKLLGYVVAPSRSFRKTQNWDRFEEGRRYKCQTVFGGEERSFDLFKREKKVPDD